MTLIDRVKRYEMLMAYDRYVSLVRVAGKWTAELLENSSASSGGKVFVAIGKLQDGWDRKDDAARAGGAWAKALKVPMFVPNYPK